MVIAKIDILIFIQLARRLNFSAWLGSKSILMTSNPFYKCILDALHTYSETAEISFIYIIFYNDQTYKFNFF